MKKIGVMFAIIITVLLVSGQNGCEGESDTGGPFIGGMEGLEAEFLDDAPSLSGNYQNENFPIEISLTNAGETEIAEEAAKVYLVGVVMSDAFRTFKTEGSNDEPLDAIERDDGGILDDETIVNMGESRYTATMYSDSESFSVRARICYPYQTKVQIDDFCIPSVSRKEVGTVECSVDSALNLIEGGDNSAAPLQVTSVVEDEGSDYVSVRVDINNQGTGQVVNVCKRDIAERTETDQVKVKMPSGFKCSIFDDSNEGVVTLRSGHARLRCTKSPKTSGAAYREQLPIILNYNY